MPSLPSVVYRLNKTERKQLSFSRWPKSEKPFGLRDERILESRGVEELEPVSDKMFWTPHTWASVLRCGFPGCRGHQARREAGFISALGPA